MIRGPEAEAALARWLEIPTLVLGVGHPQRGDDALGPLVCAEAGVPHVVDCGDAPERFLGVAGDPAVSRVLFVDAMEFGGAPGEVAFCAADELREGAGTTHTTGLALLARYLQDSYGKPVAVLGVQPGNTAFGAEMDPAVQATAARVRAALTRKASAQQEAAWTRS